MTSKTGRIVGERPPGQAPARQGRTGLVLAACIVTAWLGLHIGMVFYFPVTWPMLPAAGGLVLLQTWLSAGLFIIAHDCMHGSLVPAAPAANRLIGRICLFLYLGFSFEQTNRAHHRHHRHPGTEDDPDFDPHPPQKFWPWFVRFFIHYFSWRQVAFIAVVYAVEVWLFGANQINAMLFWALPGLLSALQLFTFGTYLPHRPPHRAADATFADAHHARSNAYPVWLSLLTCYHFGYHHEHHLFPAVPWWRLPDARRDLRAGAEQSGRSGASS
jgi:beta-carotene/zeaxanthin 4-ketolase